MQEYNNPKKSLTLFGLEKNLNFIINLYNSQKLPKVIMLSGQKGIGKFTLSNHFLSYVYDKDNYNLETKTINDQTQFFKQNLNDIYPNIVCLSGDNSNTIKIDDIRVLKSTILKSTILSRDRFIILDDIELFNTNSLNALLKVIEEPTSNNYFILINNNTKPLIETISSRALEIRIFLSNKSRLGIIDSLLKKKSLKVHIDPISSNLAPGNFILFNKICELNKIDISDNLLVNIKKLLDLYKKNKSMIFIHMTFFLINYYFYNLSEKKNKNITKIVEDKDFILKNLKKFTTYNLNQKNLINIINNRLLYE